VNTLHEYINPRNGMKAPLIAEDVYAVRPTKAGFRLHPLTAAPQAVMANAEKLDAAMDYSRDYDYDYFGFKVCGKSAARFISAASVLTTTCPRADVGAVLPAAREPRGD
jgi:hypothetical protein